MICGVVATIISGCNVCIACRVVCYSVAHYSAHCKHTTAWNICCHNAAYHTTMYFYWSITRLCSFSKAQSKLLEDGPIGPERVGANIEIF